MPISFATMVELHLKITGNVQGVFFRATIKEHAEKFSLVGHAKNLEDGSVEVVAQGKIPLLEEFLQNIIDSPGKATINKVEKEFRNPQKAFVGFRIC